MGASHRAGSGPMWVNQEHTDKPLERTLRAEPQEYAEEGVNFPYRGVEEHGVPFKGTIPDELEGSTDKNPDLVLPPHLAEPEPETEAVPVRVVSDKRVCRIPWMADQFNVDPGAKPIMIVGRQDNREYVVVSNIDTGDLYIGPDPNVKTGTGFAVPANTSSHRIKTTEAIYAVSSAGTVCSVMWEFRQEA